MAATVHDRSGHVKIKRNWWNLHTHSKFSANDALPEVRDIVQTVADYGQKAIGLTDHGNMGGTVQLYSEAAKRGLKPFPGTELYVVENRQDKSAKRHHMCVVAYTTKGYENLVHINTVANENFYHKPLLDHRDLAALADDGMLEGIAATSGCYFSMISQAIVTDNEQRAVQLMQAYGSWFDKFYVELQNHNIDHGDGWDDNALADTLMKLAEQQGLPCVITQDSHYCHEDDKPVHETLKRLVSYGTGEDAVFPGDGFHLADAEWFESHHDKQRRLRGLEGLRDLYDSHDLSIRQLDSYSYNIPFTVDDPDAELRRRAYEELEGQSLGAKYRERLNDELEIIHDTGMAGYLLLVADVAQWCIDNHVFYQARGSASGSILCWLLHITQVDPIKHELRFERFISRDRMKPPDVDLDVEHDRRKELIEWLSLKYSVNQIGTWMEYSLKSEDDDENAKGSLLVRYYSKMRQNEQPISKWTDIPAEDRQQLKTLSDMSTISSYGTNAAGLVLTTTRDEFAKLVPLMKVASSKTFVSQYDKDEIEKLGLVKMDVLGLKNLSVVHRCFDYLGRSVFDGLDWIPFSDRQTFAMISKGETAGVFQLEGKAAKYGCMNMKPTKVGDIIAAMALYRPATMQSGATDSYVKRKHKQEEIPQRHDLIMRVTKDTHGIMLYQEQVIQILRELGMTPDDLTAFLKAVKASNSDIGNAGDVIRGYKDSLSALCEQAGMNESDWKWLWTAIEGFAAYGFNKAHATAYGTLAYRTAYLACHHPVEYFAALLDVFGGDKKELEYKKACRVRGIRIKRPHLNESSVSYSVDSTGRCIRQGITNLKGIGPKTAQRIVDVRPEGGYTSIEHFARTVGNRVSGVKPFMESGDTTVGALSILKEEGLFDDL